MNPDENNNNQAPGVPPEAPEAPSPAPEATPSPEESTPSEAPASDSLDQVAADLTNAADNDILEPSPAPEAQPAPSDAAPDAAPFATPSPEASATPEVPETPATSETPAAVETPVSPLDASASPEVPVAPEAPAAPEVPSTPETPDAPITPETPEVSVTPEAPIAPEAPTTPDVPASSAAPEAPEAPAAPEATANTQPEEQSYSTSANFVGDASTPEENAESAPSSEEEEPPLEPAAPVPGSIGSALAYSETAPNHAVPVGKPAKIKTEKKPLTKENLKLLIAIIGGVTLVAVVAVVIFFIINSGTNNRTSTVRPAEEDEDTPTNTVSSLTCTLEGDATSFAEYGTVSSGEEQVIAMYSNDELSSFGITTTLTFEDEDAAKSGLSHARERYNSKITAAGLTEDPFTSSYDAKDGTVTVTHQAEGEDIDDKTAKILDLYVVKGEPVIDIDTLLDTYETDGYTCVQK